MERRKSRAFDREEEDRPREPRRRGKKQRGSARWVLWLLLGLTLAGAAGAGTYLFLRERGKATEDRERGKATEDMSDRFLGKWEGSSPERPNVKVWLEVTRERVIMTAENTTTHEGDTLPFSWNTKRVTGTTLLIHLQFLKGDQHETDWAVRFASDDEMSVTHTPSDGLIANFKRVGKRIT